MNRSRRDLLLAGGLLALGLVAILAVSDATHTIIPGDPAAYRSRVEAILARGIPYRDVPLEHLPVTLVPMFLAWFLGGATSQSDYVFIFAVIMTFCTAATVFPVEALGSRLGSPSMGRRWAILVAPLVPLVVFRNDPIPTLLFVVGALALVAGRSGWVAAAVAGALTKVWPAGLALWGIKRGRWVGSLSVVAGGVIAAAWTLLPGFTAARQGLGIHAETLVGAVAGLLRVLQGTDPGVEITTAAYLAAEPWVILLNAAIGIGVLLLGAAALKASTDDRSAFLALGTVVAGVILASQLFSLQYVLWLTPFLAASRNNRTILAGVAVGFVTTTLAWFWDPSVFGSSWYYLLLSARTGLVLALAAWMAAEAFRGPSNTSGSGRVPEKIT